MSDQQSSQQSGGAGYGAVLINLFFLMAAVFLPVFIVVWHFTASVIAAILLSMAAYGVFLYYSTRYVLHIIHFILWIWGLFYVFKIALWLAAIYCVVLAVYLVITFRNIIKNSQNKQ